ncbi:RidA family protein [Pseudomonas parafulva]|uniref:RidA family protein n=1 Tax=Pseudomonas parafulva TaxID=157782 RepID=UPI0009BCA0F5|nr:RidA family protein [Pseudomonas parafulva]
MSIERINVAERLSGATVYNGVVYLSGQVPDDRTQNCYGQTVQVLEKIDRLLSLSGSDKSKILSAQIWLKDIKSDFAALNEAWVKWLPESCAPARATIESNLASADVLVEIMVIAAQ